MLTISGMHKGETKLTIPNQVVREQLFAYILDTYHENDLTFDRVGIIVLYLTGQDTVLFRLLNACCVCNKNFVPMLSSLRFRLGIHTSEQLFHPSENGCSLKINSLLFTLAKQRTQPDKICHNYALLQRKATTTMAQELKQAVYVKPNLTNGEWQTVSRDLESIFSILLICKIP